MLPFSIANAMKATGNGEDERQYAFGRQKLFIFMARFGEICRIAVAMFYQISRSAIKKAGGFRLNIPRDAST
ncbi:hypothetical protein F8564_12255 [Serratia sp. RJAL6]|uniref:hypothetical protein n=1 Tax=Serratia marcescens TaxID=615 RepID=UPI0011F33F61|nr:hypothetical protein [Serratia marcescens]KAB5496656.1 hypothetical protein F8564_12255 [Enterobacter sp. RJAL6]